MPFCIEVDVAERDFKHTFMEQFVWTAMHFKQHEINAETDSGNPVTKVAASMLLS